MSSVLRLGLFYAALFIGTGASSPYIPVWFAHRGLSGAEIGAILSAPMLARVITGPAIALWADSFRLRRTPLTLIGAAMAVLYAVLAAPFGFVWWFGVWFMASSLMATLIPLTDVLVLQRSRQEGFNYGWARGIGSAAFILANIVMGMILARTSPESVLVWLSVSAMAVGLGGRFLLPPDPVAGAALSSRDRMAGMKDLVRDRTFMLVVMSSGLIQAAHAYYYSFSTLTWKQQGVAENLIGLLWGFGVVIEVAFLWFGEPWRRRIGPRNLLMLGGLAAVLRWTVLAFSPPLWLVLVVQPLHTFTYAATFLASLVLVEKLSTPANASAAQTISSALSGGLLMGGATIGSGLLFDLVGAKGYLAMTAMCLAGLALALPLYRDPRLAADRFS